MPYVNVKIARTGATPAQKALLISAITNALVEILGKNPASTIVVIDEVDPANWGFSGLPLTQLSQPQSGAVNMLLK
jgi:4-oxalocrotonate tautomerase